MTNKLPIFIALCGIALCAVDSTALAADPKAPVAAAYSEIQTLTRDATDRDSLIAGIDAVLSGIVDYDAFARRTLKGNWDKLKPRQRKRFKKAFKALIHRTYAKRFKPGATFTVSWRGVPAYVDELKKKAEVRSTVQGEKAAADVDYLLGNGPSGWRVHDIIVDEVSMAMNWRRQFKRILDAKGFDELIARIEKKGKR